MEGYSQSCHRAKRCNSNADNPLNGGGISFILKAGHHGPWQFQMHWLSSAHQEQIRVGLVAGNQIDPSLTLGVELIHAKKENIALAH